MLLCSSIQNELQFANRGDGIPRAVDGADHGEVDGAVREHLRQIACGDAADGHSRQRRGAHDRAHFRQTQHRVRHRLGGRGKNRADANVVRGERNRSGGLRGIMR